MIYSSPDTTVCECCKPSVAMKGNKVYVMFRNWLNGNRDLHIIQSNDGGINFGKAQKLGEGSWKLKGCPMDGGGVIINTDNSILTVFFNTLKRPEIPAMPKLANGKLDSTYPYYYVKNHWWDDVSFDDDRLVRTPFFEQKIEEYYKY